MWILQRPTTVRSAYIRESRSDIQQDGLPGPDIYLMRGDNKVSQPAQDQTLCDFHSDITAEKG